jgi:hypothetical protein
MSRSRDKDFGEKKTITEQFNIEWDAHFNEESIDPKIANDGQEFPVSFDAMDQKAFNAAGSTSSASADFDPFGDTDDKSSIDALIT